MTVNPELDRRTRSRYSQELAAYTLRQFSTARAQLDEGKKEDIAKLPAAYQRVVSAEKLSSHGMFIFVGCLASTELEIQQMGLALSRRNTRAASTMGVKWQVCAQYAPC